MKRLARGGSLRLRVTAVREGDEEREARETQRATSECSAFRIPGRCVAEYGNAPPRDSTLVNDQADETVRQTGCDRPARRRGFRSSRHPCARTGIPARRTNVFESEDWMRAVW